MPDDYYEQAKPLAARPYTTYAFRADDYCYARAVEVSGCMGSGTTLDEAIEDFREALIDYIAVLLEDGLDVPEPKVWRNGEVIEMTF